MKSLTAEEVITYRKSVRAFIKDSVSKEGKALALIHT
jgi:hypothetical protein